MPLEIILNKEPPKELLKVIKEHYDCQRKTTKENLVNSVLIDANNERIGKDSLGGFFPDTKEIVIDLAHCVENKGWMGYGMMMIQTVWFNILRAVFHELGHAIQLAQNPALKEMKILTPDLEQDADTYANEMISYWASNGGTIPKINDMGWAGDQIKLLINTCYSNKWLRPKILEELEVLEANGIAEVDNFTAHNQKTMKKEEYNNLCEDIDSKKIGIKLNNKRYLDPINFFSLIIDENKERLKTGLTEYYISEEPPEENANKVLIDNFIKS